MVDVIPWIVHMRRLDQYSVLSTYDRWAEEVQAVLTLAGVWKAVKGGDGVTPAMDDTARSILLLTIERDVRDFMAGKVKIDTAGNLWAGVKKARQVLLDEEEKKKKAAARSPRAGVEDSFQGMSVGGSTTSGWT